MSREAEEEDANEVARVSDDARDDGDAGETPTGALRGRIAAVLWPPSAMRAVTRDASRRTRAPENAN